MFKYLPPYDKCLHFIGGTILAVSVIWLGMVVSVLLVALMAAGKEVWDHNNPPHRADVWDAIATVFGALPIWAVWILK